MGSIPISSTTFLLVSMGEADSVAVSLRRATSNVAVLRIVYLGQEPLTSDELLDTLKVYFYEGLPFGSVSGPIPVEEFKTDRVIIGQVDDIKVETCGQDLTSNTTRGDARV
ncbi:MAG: hypothetical protein R2761_31115 [Acidimicrobiales bacterium]